MVYAVITGDFIGFSPLSAETREALYHIAQAGSTRLQSVFEKSMPEPVAIYRGDAWQMLLSRPVAALRAGLLFRSYVRSRAPFQAVDMRMAIGVGAVDYVPDGNVSAGDGPAFRLSGKLLEAMATPRNGTLRFAMNGSSAAKALDGLAVLAGCLAERWSPSQAQAIEGALCKLTQQQIAESWVPRRVSYQAVGGHLRRAGWPALRHALASYESSLSSLKFSA
jgi:hypothetical protein